jgi:hypothetical protein
MGTLKSFLENIFKNLGVASTPLRCFQKRFWKNKDDLGG